MIILYRSWLFSLQVFECFLCELKQRCLYSVIQWKTIVCQCKYFMKHAYFSIIWSSMAHPDKRVVTKWEVKKAFISNFLLFNLIKLVNLADSDVFLLVFLHKSDMWLLKLKLTSIFILSSFSHSLLSIVQLPILIATGLLGLTNAWRFSALLSKQVFLNQSNKALEASSNDAMTFSIFPLIVKGVLSSA